MNKQYNKNEHHSTRKRYLWYALLFGVAYLLNFQLTAQSIYLDGGLVKANPYGYPGISSSLRNQLNAIKNADATSAQESGFWLRSNGQLDYFRANYNVGHGGKYFENEKASYPYAMYHLMYGMAHENETIINNARTYLQTSDPFQTGHTDGIDLFPSFTLKGQMPKYFYFGKNAEVLTQAYRDKFYAASNVWSEIDPFYRPSQYFTGGGSCWHQECRNSWVDIRNTDNLKAMRESSAFLLADETGNTAVKDIYFERIKNHAATLFYKGYSEWDSENYFSHSVAPWLNLYTYTTDIEMKKLSKAALDWYMTAGAAKYFNGMMAGPTKRLNNGANIPVNIDAASMLHAYFGDHAIPSGAIAHDRDTYISMLSSYRPPQSVYQLASKDFTPYVEQINSKPQYGVFTPTHSSSPSAWETMFYGTHYQMGSVVTAGEVGDMRAFKLAASSSTEGSEVFYAYSTPSDASFIHYKRGGDQLSQHRDKMIFLRSGGSKFGFQVPTNVPIQVESGIWFFRYEKTWIAIRPININYPSGTPMTGGYSNLTNYISQPDGSPAYSGFAMEVGDEGQSSYNAFKTAVKAKTLDLSELSSGTVTLNGRDGSYLKTTYNTSNDRPILYRNSEEVYNFYEGNLNHSVYRSVTPPLADLTSAVADGSTVNFSVTASDPERGLISQDYESGTLRVITNDYVFTTTVTLAGDVTYSEVPATASNTQGSLKAVEFYAGELKIGEITDPGQLASGNMTFAWTDAITGTHEVRARAIDEEGNTTWSNTRSVTVSGGAQEPVSISVNPTADTYSKDGSDANNNYGTSSYLETKLNTGANREAYFKFNLNEVTGPITDAKLRVFGRLINHNTPTVSTSVYPVADTTWAETGLTHNNKPASGSTALASVNISGITWTWYEWDVADYLEAERAAGRKIVTLVLKNTTTSDPFNWYESRENNNKPEIELTYTPLDEEDGPGTGLLATYYDTRFLSGNEVVRVDPQVNFNWGSGSPHPDIPVNYFSTRWTGQVKADHTETYTFYARTDDGVRLWVDGTQLVDRWQNQSATERSGTISLVAGEKYDIVVEYYENAGAAVAELRWSSPSTSKQFIPQENLYPSTGGSSGRFASNSFEEVLDQNQLEGFSIYPNPSSHELFFTLPNNDGQNVEISVIDIFGRSVMQFTESAIEDRIVSKDISRLSGGQYIVTFVTGDVRTTKKLIIAK